jgi:hypothetical protein
MRRLCRAVSKSGADALVRAGPPGPALRSSRQADRGAGRGPRGPSHKNRHKWSAIWLAAVLASPLLWPQSNPDKQKSAFAGTVRDSVTKIPIAKASVHVIPLAANQPAYAGVSDATGAFRFEAITPGDYRLEIRARGYADGQAAAIEARGVSTVHFTAGKEVAGAIVELDPEAVITGRVTDADGEPVPSATVSAVTEQWQRGFRIYKQVTYAQANDRGEFRLKVLPGRYYLKALPTLNAVEPSVFAEEPGEPEMRGGAVVYPNAATIDAGSPIEVRPGQQLSGITFKRPVVAAYHLRGAVKLYSPPAPQVVVILRNRNGDRSPGSFYGATVKKDGTFDIIGVPAGSYWLELMPVRDSPTGLMAVDVIDRDLNGIKLPSILQFDLKGKVRWEDDGVTEPLSSVKLHIDWLDWFQFNLSSVATPAADGAFVFPFRPAGVWVITLAPESDVYIQSISYNQREVEGGRFDLRNGAAGDVEIVLGTGTGQVGGNVTWPDLAPGAPPPPLPPGTTAVLVSAAGVTGNTGARSAEIDQSGHFQFPFVPPGRYFVFVGPRYDEGLWQNADFVREIQASGVGVEVPKKGSAQAEVPILTNDDLRHAMEKVPR